MSFVPVERLVEGLVFDCVEIVLVPSCTDCGAVASALSAGVPYTRKANSAAFEAVRRRPSVVRHHRTFVVVVVGVLRHHLLLLLRNSAFSSLILQF